MMELQMLKQMLGLKPGTDDLIYADIMEKFVIPEWTDRSDLILEWNG